MRCRRRSGSGCGWWSLRRRRRGGRTWGWSTLPACSAHPWKGGRIIFAESLYLTEGEQWALDHIAKQELDTAVATAFFDDPGRLNRDILGDAAVAYLNTLSLE
ncbi:MAG TPA: hypothetical protein VE844_03855 [Gammaproteobacteria bacterium]|nr:hypothetical protein [Gammaproteobacteria bacterium]